MIERKQLLALNFYKKEVFTGSYLGMRYLVKKEEDQLIAVIWPEPFNCESTPDEQKEHQSFPFSEEGLVQTAEWLNSQYNSQKERWDEASRIY